MAKHEKKEYYVTSASNMPLGTGYWTIMAHDEAEARQIAFNLCPDGRWSFLYSDLSLVHPMDRLRHHGVLEVDVA